LFGIKAGVDNAAHIGGLVSGLLVGMVLYISLKQPQNKVLERIILVSLIGVTLAGSLFGMSRIENPVGEYVKIMDKYSEYEEKAISVYRLPETTDQETLLKIYNNTTIPNLELCNEELQKIHRLNLPDELKQRVSKMDEYTSLRIKEANLRKKSLTENTTNYLAAIEELVKQIDALLKELNQ
jgi:rhomboid protease GluP